MDAGITFGILGLVAGFGSAFATLYVAKRGGTFRQRSPELLMGGHSLPSGRELNVIYGIPVDRGNILSKLLLEIHNPGDDTVDDVVMTVIMPQHMGGFYDKEKGKENITFSVSRGVDPGTSTKAELVGIHNRLHFTVKSIHSRTGVAIEIPVMFPGAFGNMAFTVPVTFKDGKTADLQMRAQISIPVEILLMARNRRTQLFTMDFEVYAPRAFGFRPLAAEWLMGFALKAKENTSPTKKVAYWLRVVFGFHRCLLVLPKYHQTEIKNPDMKSKSKPISAYEEVTGSKKYAIGYLVSFFAFYRPIKPRTFLK